MIVYSLPNKAARIMDTYISCQKILSDPLLAVIQDPIKHDEYLYSRAEKTFGKDFIKDAKKLLAS